MSRIEIELCECCERQLGDRNGFAVTVNHSRGGWGHSETLFNNGSAEVCNQCYDYFMKLANGFADAWENRRGINRPVEVKL